MSGAKNVHSSSLSSPRTNTTSIRRRFRIRLERSWQLIIPYGSDYAATVCPSKICTRDYVMAADDEPFANKIAKRIIVGFASICILPYIYLLLLAATACIGRGDKCGGGDGIQSLGIVIYVLFVPECIAALIVFYALARTMTNLGLGVRCIWSYVITLSSCLPYAAYLLHEEGGLFLFLISIIPIAGAAFIVFAISSFIATWKMVEQARRST